MRRIFWLARLHCCLILLVGSALAAPAPEINVYFSPTTNGIADAAVSITKAVIAELMNAKTNVLVQAYSFTSPAIAEAVAQAHKRGVKVEVILDKSRLTEKYNEADFLAHAGVRVLIDGKHAIAHNKLMVIDGATVITGSFNFTKAAEERNAENLLVIRDKATAERYIANWQQHEKHSEPYQAK